MINSSNRAFIFLFGCIGVRLIMAYIPQILPKKYFTSYGSYCYDNGIRFLKIISYKWKTTCI